METREKVIETLAVLHVIKNNKGKIKRREFIVRNARKLGIKMSKEIVLSKSVTFDFSYGLCTNLYLSVKDDPKGTIVNHVDTLNHEFAKKENSILYPVGGGKEFSNNRNMLMLYTNKRRWDLLDYWIKNFSILLEGEI